MHQLFLETSKNQVIYFWGFWEIRPCTCTFTYAHWKKKCWRQGPKRDSYVFESQNTLHKFQIFFLNKWTAAIWYQRHGQVDKDSCCWVQQCVDTTETLQKKSSLFCTRSYRSISSAVARLLCIFNNQCTLKGWALCV